MREEKTPKLEQMSKKKIKLRLREKYDAFKGWKRKDKSENEKDVQSQR